MENIGTELKATLDEQYEELIGAIYARQGEIDRLNTAPKTRSVGKAHYEAVNADSQDAVDIAAAISAGGWSKASIDFQVGKNIVRRVAAEKSESVKSTLGEIDSHIKEVVRSMQQVALSEKSTARVRGASSGGSHAITKAWFDAHQNECPAGMAVAWDDQNSKITYNLPKGGRGATVSHGALNNILKAFGGRNNEMSHDEPVEQPVVKEIPKKVSKKAGKK